MKRVEISTTNWTSSMANAVRESDAETTIVVHSDAQRELALRTAKRLGKIISVEVKKQ